MYRIRLYGIDMPEKKQAFGQKAKKFTSDFVFNKDLIVIPKGMDRYGRTIEMVYIGNKCLNTELIKNGFSWVYKKYCNEAFCQEWFELEATARKDKIGL